MYEDIKHFLRQGYMTLELLGYFFVSFLYYIESALLYMIPRVYKRQNIEGKLVLITGGAQGLGEKTAKKLAKKGAIVVIWDIDENGLKTVKKEIEDCGGTCHTYVVDVSNAKAVSETAEIVKEKHGKVHILVNNAGILKVNELLQFSEESILKQFNVNIISHFWTLRAFLPAMEADNDGQIVSVATIGAKFPTPYHSVYCSTKMAVCSLDETLRMELDLKGCDKVHTTLVCPFFTNTTMAKGIDCRVHPTLDAEYVTDEIVDGILMKSRWVIIPNSFRSMICFKGFGHHKMDTIMMKACLGDLTQFERLDKERSKRD